MNASAYLLRHGWTGGGLGYHQSGVKKPVLASQKRGFSGVGIKANGGQSDQWWLGVFDAGLKEIGSSAPVAIAKTPDKEDKCQAPAFFKAELYRNFVRGEGLTGTLERKQVDRTQTDTVTKHSTRSALDGPSHRRSDMTKVADDRRQGSSRKKTKLDKGNVKDAKTKKRRMTTKRKDVL